MLKVLIIDDDEIVLLVQRKILQRCEVSNNPYSFKNGHDALKFLEKESGEYFLILLDINMPGMNGWQFLEKLKEVPDNKEIFVIMVTSSIDGYDKVAAGKYSNVIGFIEKPITAENCSKIRTLPQVVQFFN